MDIMKIKAPYIFVFPSLFLTILMTYLGGGLVMMGCWR